MQIVIKFMKKRVFLFLITIALTAVSTSVNAQNAAKARQVLDKTSALIMGKGGATANFTLSGNGIGSASGTVSVKGNKFYASTPNIKVWNNGKTQWTYTRSTNEVTVSKPNDAQQMTANPYKFITIYKSGYALSLKETGGQYEIHLKAIHPGRSIQEAFINISHSYYPTKVRMRQGKKWATITISGLRTRNIPNSSFEFNKKAYPNAEIVDLR